MIDSNVKGLMYVTKAVLPKMIESKKGQIINLGSIAGKEVYPNGNVYCSSKAAVDFFTRGLRIDLNPIGIRVGAIHPGLVETEFSEVRFKGNKSVQKVFTKELMRLKLKMLRMLLFIWLKYQKKLLLPIW